MFDEANVTAGANRDREAVVVSPFTVRNVSEFMGNVKRVVDSVNIESFNGGDIKGMAEGEANRNVSVESPGCVCHRAVAIGAFTIDFIDVLIFQNRARTKVLAGALHEERSIIENQFKCRAGFDERIDRRVELAVFGVVKVD